MGGEGETVEEAVSLRACMAAHLPAAAFAVCVMRCVQAELIRFDSKAAVHVDRPDLPTEEKVHHVASGCTFPVVPIYSTDELVSEPIFNW